LLVAACSKDEPKPKETRILGGRGVQPAMPAPAPTEEPAPDNGSTPPTQVDPDHVLFQTNPDAGPNYVTVTKRVDAASIAPDPDLAVIEQGRKAAGACFTGITDGSYSRSATIHLIVLPTGTVNRSEVSAPGTSEPWILSCLDGVGSGLHFSEKPKADIRNFYVGATVTLSRTH
jgi:hypothetical protein